MLFARAPGSRYRLTPPRPQPPTEIVRMSKGERVTDDDDRGIGNHDRPTDRPADTTAVAVSSSSAVAVMWRCARTALSSVRRRWGNDERARARALKWSPPGRCRCRLITPISRQVCNVMYIVYSTSRAMATRWQSRYRYVYVYVYYYTFFFLFFFFIVIRARATMHRAAYIHVRRVSTLPRDNDDDE